MEHAGIDLGKRESQIAIITEAGELVEKRLRTERERLRRFFVDRPKSRILMEASTISEWVARVLEELGHEVVVADPNYAPMYAQRSRRVKTDKRDAQALAEACRLGAYHPAHRTSDEQRHVRALLGVRESLVRARVRFVGLVQATLSREGFRVPTGTTRLFGARVRDLDLPEHLVAEIAPLLAMFEPLKEQIDEVDAQLVEMAQRDDRVKRLMTMPQIGPLTALSFVATLDEVGRFRGAHQVAAYLGLVPREWSSSETQRRGRITKAGNARVRWLLVEAAWRVATEKKRPATEPVRNWAGRIARRRGKRVAMVALARKLSGILYAMWRDGSAYDPVRLSGVGSRAAEEAA
jgi:transposase